MLTFLAKLLSALNSEASPGQVAFAFALGMIVGFTPFWSFLNLFVLLIALMVRINFSAFIFGVMVFSLLGYALDPVSIHIGETLLLNPDLRDTWTSLYQNEWLRISAFNNTLTLGGLLLALVALIPVTVISRLLVIQYRHRFMAWMNKLKVVQMLKASKFYALYNTFAG